jgi:hypothetical protein
MYNIDRTDFCILTAFKAEDGDTIITLDKPTDGITITEIISYLETINVSKCRRTVYMHLTKLFNDGYIGKGIVNNHADTYFIKERGQQALRGESI